MDMLAGSLGCCCVQKQEVYQLLKKHVLQRPFFQCWALQDIWWLCHVNKCTVPCGVLPNHELNL